VRTAEVTYNEVDGNLAVALLHQYRHHGIPQAISSSVLNRSSFSTLQGVCAAYAW
jgi:hypothetical protein